MAGSRLDIGQMNFPSGFMQFSDGLISVHPETVFPDERAQLSAISFQLNVLS